MTRAIARIPSVVLLGLVLFYRKWLSPLKRRRCAHGVLASESCSSVGARALRDLPLLPALAAIHRQFRACAAAREIIIAASEGRVELTDMAETLPIGVDMTNCIVCCGNSALLFVRG